MKLLKLTPLIMILTSCSTRYGMILGGQKVTYTESADIDTFSPTASDDPIFDDYQNSSMGFHIGLSEETPSSLTKITYFQNFYDDLTYSFDGNDYDTSLSESGIRASIAWKLWVFQPYIYFSSYNSEYKIDSETSNSSYTAVGFGLDMEFQLTKRSFFYIGYSSDTYSNVAFAGSSLVTQELNHVQILVGLRYNFQENYSGMKN